jgi:hypothetical protein
MLIEVSDTPLSKIMQGVQQTYTGRYNHFNKRTGHVFEQRYRAFLCHSDEQLLSTIHYIHHNPARAGLPGGINNPFCSHRTYLRGLGDGLTDVDKAMSILGPDRQSALRRYEEYMVPDEFLADGLYQALDNERAYRLGIAALEPDRLKIDLPDVMTACAGMFGLESSELTRGGRVVALSMARRVLVQFCLKHTRISGKELAAELGISQPAVSQAASVVSEEVSAGVEQLLIYLKSRPDPN